MQNSDTLVVIENSDMTENLNMNINDVNSDEDIIDLENSKSHVLGLFATLEKKENEKQMLKVGNQSLKFELKESQKDNIGRDIFDSLCVVSLATTK